MTPQRTYPILTMHQQSAATTPEPVEPREPREAVDYLAPVLAAYDTPDEAVNRERATALYCRGHRIADIATRLDVSVSTITTWLTDARYLLSAELRASREELTLRAIESARAVAAEAWEAYERDEQIEREILAGQHDYLRRRVTRPDRASPHRVASDEGSTDEDAGGDLLYEEFERPRHSRQAARFLMVALAAQREVARLQGLHKYVAPPPQPVEFKVTGAVADASGPIAPDQPDQLDQPDSAEAGAVLAPDEITCDESAPPPPAEPSAPTQPHIPAPQPPDIPAPQESSQHAHT
ncbi:MAG TPA: hypothetical protein VKQ30_16740 [Ktedonobacterales bacterium]|nr:hypothetical protein [Ktedonobacterales bacterium]